MLIEKMDNQARGVTYYNDKMKVIYETREENKQYVIDKVIELLGGILWEYIIH